MATPVVAVITTKLINSQGPRGPQGIPGPAGRGAAPIRGENLTTPEATSPAVGDQLQVVIEAGWYGAVQWRRGLPDDESVSAGPIVGADASTYEVTPFDVAIALPIVVTFGSNPMFAFSFGVPVGEGAPDNVVTVDGEFVTVDGEFVTVETV